MTGMYLGEESLTELSERIKALEAERDRYREALEKILNDAPNIDHAELIAETALNPQEAETK